MPTSEHEELTAIIAEKFEGDFGARASHLEVYQAVLETVPQHIVTYFAANAIRRKVTDFFNRKTDTGLPFAPVANDSGEHVPVPLMDFAELEYVATRYVRKASPLIAQAHRVAREAKEKFGRTIVVDGVDLSESPQSDSAVA